MQKDEDEEIMEMYTFIDGEDVTLHIRPDKGILNWKPKEKALKTVGVEINSIGADILCMFNGEASLESIATFFSDKYNDNLENVRHKILKFIVDLKNKGTPIKLSFFPQFHKLSIYGSKYYIIPIHAAIELTYKCNLKCRHCYVESDISRNEIMPLERVKSLLDELKEIGVTTVELTGGEPTAHPNFFEILKYTVDLDFTIVGVLTNGTLLDNRITDYIIEHKDKVVTQIDLHGSKPEYVKWFTGTDFTFEKEKLAIKYLASKGAIIRVVANIGPLNIDQMEEIAIFSKEVGVTAVGFSPIVPMGRAIENDEKNELLISDEHILSKFFETFENLKRVYGSFVYSLEESEANVLNCGAGSRSITISPQGFIKLCQMAPHTLPLGSVFDDSLKNILERNKDLFLSVGKLLAPSIETRGSCENLNFCEKCITRGIIKAKENKEECIWYRKYIQGTVLEKLLG